MSYSFKQARSKSLFKKDTKFWIAFLVISVSIMLGLQIALSMKLTSTIDGIKSTRTDKEDLVKKTIEIKDEYAILKEHVIYANKLNAENSILKESMKNLFEIVPDKIILNKIEITPTTLTIFGTTPSRDIFNLQFAPALKSIFTKSETSFIRAEKGTSRFISINYIAQGDTEAVAEETPKKNTPAPEHPESKKGHE